ncbi:helix-turn-helix domain-containing protein [Seongchinamella unica]|nr:helix-turn-helix domain-containing protein [Seongchinamella unica]
MTEHPKIINTWRSDHCPLYSPKDLGLNVREEAIVQLRPGDFTVDVSVASSENVSLVSVATAVDSVGVTVLDPGYTAFALPVSWSGEYLVNGESASASNLYMPGEHDSFHLRSKSRLTQGVIVPRLAFTSTVAALRGVDLEDVELSARVLRMHPKAGAMIRARIAAILNEVMGSKRPRRTALELEEEILGLMAEAYVGARQSPRGRVRRTDRIVRLAEERFMAAEGGPLSLADICMAAGVSKSAVYTAFDRVCGVSPLAYFHKRRLTDVRSKLVNGAPRRGLVKQTALEAGLSELGRFAGEYRELFGELPSTTLNRQPP